MVKRRVPPDFKEFLRLLNEHDVHYLLIGGHAVGFYGYPRATQDMDIWVEVEPTNAEKLVLVLKDFGFTEGSVDPAIFLREDNALRLGIPPVRLEILMSIAGVHFDSCYPRRLEVEIDGVAAQLIHLDDLRVNKIATGRHKDLDDVSNLPETWPAD